MNTQTTPSPFAGQRHYVLAIDGACIPNPGPGGWGGIRQIIEADGSVSAQLPYAGHSKSTTNNRMEMTAAIRGLSLLDIPDLPLLVLTDSKQVVMGMTEWMPGWKERAWRTADKKPVKNHDLWLQLDTLAQTRPIQWQWVKGHAGHGLNEMADRLANNGALKTYAKPGCGLKDLHHGWYLGTDTVIMKEAA